MKNWIYIGALCLVLSGCTEPEYTPLDLTPELQETTLTIGAMQAMWDGENPLTFTEDHLIGGVVTASDASGNFYRTFIIDDYTGAVEVMAGLYDLHTIYPIGRVVYINLKGLTLARNENEIYRLGHSTEASSRYAVDYIGHSGLLDRYVTRAGMNYEFRILDLAIPDLADHLSGRLVTVHGISLGLGGETTWATPGGTASKELRADDPYGRWIYIHTSDYADFAGEAVPAGNVSISGILMKERGVYRLKMRDLRDVFAH